MPAPVEALKTHLTETMNELKELVHNQSAEIEKSGASSRQTAAAIAKADERLAAITEELEEKSKRLDELEKRLNRPDFADTDGSPKSLGEAYIKSDAFKNASSIGRGNEVPVEFIRKDITSAAASAGALTSPMRAPEIQPNAGVRPVFIRQLIPTIPTQEGSVDIMRRLAFTNNAGPQYNVAKTPVNELVDKNKSDITFELANIPVRTIAHYFVVARQTLADAPALRSEIDTLGIYGLNLEMDSQILYGDGTTGKNFTGFFVDNAVNDIGEIASGTLATSVPGAMIGHVRKAITKQQQSEFYNINGLIINPVDWEAIETAKDGEGRYLWVNVPAGGEQRLWRVPVVVSNAVSQGDFLLGDWQLGAALYTREAITVRTSEHHDKLFTQNGVAILIEERAALGIKVPQAFCKGSFDVAS